MEIRYNRKRLGRLHYLVKLDDGYTIKRHIEQLRSTKVPPEHKKKVSFPPTDTTQATRRSQRSIRPVMKMNL